MGGGIAAHLANAGIPSLLLDIVPPDLPLGSTSERSRFAVQSLGRVVAAKPALLFHPSLATLITPGNLEDDFARLETCDLVIEAVPERLDLKRNLLERLEAVVSPTTVVASNTSGLRISDMLQGRSAAFRKNFLVMHFFNPVRYMKLLELVAGPETAPDVLANMRRFGEDVLGKGVVVAKDTPNFIGNRIGTHAMLTAIHLMLSEGLTPEDTDAITGVPLGHPKSANFRTGDIVGLDTFAHVADHCYEALTHDEDRDVFRLPSYIRTMTEKKLLGDKTRGGFYRKAKDGSLETLDPHTLEYRPNRISDDIASVVKSLAKIESPAARIQAIAKDPGRAGDMARKYLARTFAYAARRIGEISDDISSIDQAMRWGYNWELGSFEAWDAVGLPQGIAFMEQQGMEVPSSVRKLVEQGITRFYRPDGTAVDLTQAAYGAAEQDPRTRQALQARCGSAPVLTNAGAEAWDVGDGVLALTFTSKANSLDDNVIAMLGQAVECAERDFQALLITNQGDHFCVGANLPMILTSASQEDWESIRRVIRTFQQAVQRIKYAAVPVVAAPYGMTLGGGLELCLGCDSLQASAETYAGLVEVGVGLLPGGGGTLNLLWRALESVPEGTVVNVYAYVTQVFKNIALARVSTSAYEAKMLGYFRASDGISFDQARQFVEAKARAVGVAASGYHAPAPRAYRLPGESGIATLGMMIDALEAGGQATVHDGKIARKIAHVLCGGIGGAGREITENEMLELEAEAFVSLCGEAKSRERMQHMLKTNKPLRN